MLELSFRFRTKYEYQTPLEYSKEINSQGGEWKMPSGQVVDARNCWEDGSGKVLILVSVIP